MVHNENAEAQCCVKSSKYGRIEVMKGSIQDLKHNKQAENRSCTAILPDTKTMKRSRSAVVSHPNIGVTLRGVV